LQVWLVLPQGRPERMPGAMGTHNQHALLSRTELFELHVQVRPAQEVNSMSCAAVTCAAGTGCVLVLAQGSRRGVMPNEHVLGLSCQKHP